MEYHKSVHKRNSRPCPECSGILYEVYHTVNIDDVQHHEKFIECEECDFEEKIKDKHNRHKIEDYFIEE